MGEVAEQVGRFVNAYSGDLKDESPRRAAGRGGRDRQRHGRRSSRSARSRWRSSARRLRTCRASIEVVPYSSACMRRPARSSRDGAILLIAGRDRPQGRGDLPARRPRRRLGRGPSRKPRPPRSLPQRRTAAGDRSGRNGSFRRTPVAVGDRGSSAVGRGSPHRWAAFVSPPPGRWRRLRHAARGVPAHPARRTGGRPTSRAPGTRAASVESPTRTTSRRCPTRPAHGSCATPPPTPRSRPGRDHPPRAVRGGGRPGATGRGDGGLSGC